MAKKRVHEIAKERDIPSKDVLAALQKAGLEVTTASSSVDEAEAAKALAKPKKAAKKSDAKPSGDGEEPAAKAEPAALAPLPSAFAASASSTLEDAVVTSRPAFWSAARTSFEGMSLSFAISWTRFFAMR